MLVTETELEDMCACNRKQGERFVCMQQKIMLNILFNNLFIVIVSFL